MNLNIVPTSVMVAISEEWLTNPRVAAAVTRHPMGGPMWDELGRAHGVLLASRKERMAIEARLATLGKRIVELGGLYNRKARALRNLLLDLAEATDDPERAAFYHNLDALMFPHKLRIINRSYWERAGAVMELEERVTPEILDELESLRVCEQSLADIFRAWVEAGHELGRCIQERARIEASLSRDGTAASQTYARQVRAAWIHVVRLIMHALPVLRLSETEREDLLAPLERGVQEALARRARAGAKNQPAPDDTAPDDAAPDDTAPDDAGPEPTAEASPGSPPAPPRPGEPPGRQRARPASAREPVRQHGHRPPSSRHRAGRCRSPDT